MLRVGGVVSGGIVMAGAKGIVGARKPELLMEHSGHIEVTKGMGKIGPFSNGLVIQKWSSAGEVCMSHFEDIQEVFLPDIQDRPRFTCGMNMFHR